MKLRDGVSLNLRLKKSLKRLDRVEVERRVGESSEAATIRLIDNKRHCYATRSTTVAARADLNVFLGAKCRILLRKKVIRLLHRLVMSAL